MKSSRGLLLLKLGLYTAGIVLLMVIPTSELNAGHSICLIKNFMHMDCPGCGMTRAISSILHGEWFRAFQYNKLVFIVFPLLCYIGVKTAINDFRNHYHEVR